MATLELVGGDIELQAQFLAFKDHVLRGGHGVVVLVPARDLVVVHGEEPGDERHEVDELLGGVLSGQGEERPRDGLETPASLA